MAGSGSGTEPILESTPTWIVAAVCAVIVLISLIVAFLIELLGKTLEKKKLFTLHEALQKVKEELMLLGFIALLLAIIQNATQRICIDAKHLNAWLPCKKNEDDISPEEPVIKYCKNGKVPLLSVEAIHQIHIFIFVLAVTHIVLSLTTILLGFMTIRRWNTWEQFIKDGSNEKFEKAKSKALEDSKKTQRKRFLLYLVSFGKQFWPVMTIGDYVVMRETFIDKHMPNHRDYDFDGYLKRALEEDFKTVVGIDWYLWLVVIVFLLLNVSGWHAYFWISFIPLIVLLLVGTQLEFIIGRLFHKVLKNRPVLSDDYFLFKNPRSVLILIHFIQFANAFELAYFFWILVTYGYNSCIMDRSGYVIPRLIISAFVQGMCSYSTLPLYAIVSHMGDQYYTRAVFRPSAQHAFKLWSEAAKEKIPHAHSKKEKVTPARVESTISNDVTTLIP